MGWDTSMLFSSSERCRHAGAIDGMLTRPTSVNRLCFSLSHLPEILVNGADDMLEHNLRVSVLVGPFLVGIGEVSVS